MPNIKSILDEHFDDDGLTDFVGPIDDVPAPINTPPTTPAVIKPDIKESDDEQKKIETDFNYVRENIYDGIEKTSIALQRVSQILENVDKAYAFEIVSTLTSSLTILTTNLIDLHLKKQRLSKDDKEKDGPTKVTNNNVIFGGSTQELLDALKKSQSNE